MNKKYRRIICISDENYRALKQLGTVGDSFNDVMTQLLKKEKPLQTKLGVGAQ